MRVRIEVSEPLDLLPSAGSLLVYGEVNDAQSNAGELIIDVRPPVDVIGSNVAWLKITPRYGGESFDQLGVDQQVIVAGEMRAAAGAPEPMLFLGAAQRVGEREGARRPEPGQM